MCQDQSFITTLKIIISSKNINLFSYTCVSINATVSMANQNTGLDPSSNQASP